MTINIDFRLNSFNAWSGAVDTLDRIQREGKCEELENILEDLIPRWNVRSASSMIYYGSILNWCMNGLGIRSENRLERNIKEAEDETG